MIWGVLLTGKLAGGAGRTGTTGEGLFLAAGLGSGDEV
ncbi:hypothetical protein C789_4309 [Microcystis aeruginosa FACHB-905 = DIANCHI905]|nr:hypothetical protein C789_4309 [Microcystis aeruginosa FACHB-905 = DIANCHI905]